MMDNLTRTWWMLGPLLAVGGVISCLVFLYRDGNGPPLAEETDASHASRATGTSPAATTYSAPSQTPGASGAAPVSEIDLEFPEEARNPPPEESWHIKVGKEFAEPGTRVVAAFDPLMVKNVDVVDPQRREYIAALKEEWKLDGIISTKQTRPVYDGDSQTPEVETIVVLEVTFIGKRRPYKEGDRLTGTRFSIQKIFENRQYFNEDKSQVVLRSGIDLISDTGAPLTLFLYD